MEDSVFFDSSLNFIFGQFDILKEANERINKSNKPKKNGTVERNERVEKQSFRKLSAKEIADLKEKARKGV